MIQLGFDSADIQEGIDVLLVKVNTDGVSAQELLSLKNKLEETQKHLAEAGIYLFVLMITVFVTSMIVRAFGWEDTNTGEKLNRFGILFPTLLATLLLFLASSWID